MPQLIFHKRDLTGPMGLLRHFPTDLVNSALTELANYELIRQGRKQLCISHSILSKSASNFNHKTFKKKSK